MKYSISQFKEKLPALTWSVEELAQKLSTIGHETEAEGDILDITLTSNRKDCQKLEYLLFDLSGIYFELRPTEPLITFNTGTVIEVSADDVNKLLGSHINDEDFQKLSQLGFRIDGNKVTVPDFRTDITTKADIAEEITRLIGFDAITVADLSRQPTITSPEYEQRLTLKQVMTDLGFTETATNSFASAGERELKNPFTVDEPYLRSTLLDGLLQTLAKNPFLKRAMFFEVGDIYTPEESTKLGMVISGYKDIDSIKASLESKLGLRIELAVVDSTKLEKLDVKQPRVMFAEVALSNIQPLPVNLPTMNLKKFTKISKFPPLVRDVTVSRELNEVEELAQKLPGLLFVEQIDSFNKDGQTLNTFRIVMQKVDGSFTDSEIQEIDSHIQNLFNIG